MPIGATAYSILRLQCPRTLNPAPDSITAHRASSLHKSAHPDALCGSWFSLIWRTLLERMGVLHKLVSFTGLAILG